MGLPASDQREVVGAAPGSDILCGSERVDLVLFLSDNLGVRLMKKSEPRKTTITATLDCMTCGVE